MKKNQITIIMLLIAITSGSILGEEKLSDHKPTKIYAHQSLIRTAKKGPFLTINAPKTSDTPEKSILARVKKAEKPSEIDAITFK